MSLATIALVVALVLAFVAEAEGGWRNWLAWSWIAFLAYFLIGALGITVV